MIIYFLLLNVLLTPFYFFRFEILNIPTNLLEVSILVSLIAFVASAFIYRKKIIWGEKYFYLIIVIGLLGIFLAQDKINALGILKGWFLVPMIFYWLLLNNCQKSDLKKLFYPLYLSLMILSLWGIAQKLGIVTVMFYQNGDPTFAQYLYHPIRAFGPFESPNFLAMYLVPIVFISWGLLKKYFDKNILLKIGFILPVLALISTNSKGGLLAFVAGLSIYLLNFFSQKIQDKKIKRLVFITSIVAVCFILGLTVFHNFNTDTGEIRREIYKYSWQMIKANPILGVGLGDFTNELQKFNLSKSFIQFGLPYALHPHNLFFSLWLNLGFAGLLLFFWIVKNSIVGLIKNIDILSVCLMGAFGAIIVHGFFDTTYFKNDLSIIFWLIVAISSNYKR